MCQSGVTCSPVTLSAAVTSERGVTVCHEHTDAGRSRQNDARSLYITTRRFQIRVRRLIVIPSVGNTSPHTQPCVRTLRAGPRRP